MSLMARFVRLTTWGKTMLYPAWKDELIALVNAKNNSSFTSTDLDFSITEQKPNGDIAVKITPNEGVSYYGSRTIHYTRRDPQKAVLGVPLTLLVNSSLTLGNIIAMIQDEYGLTFDAAVDFAESTLSQHVDFESMGLKELVIPIAGSSMVWVGELSLMVADDALQLTSIIAKGDLTSISYWDADRITTKTSLDLITRALPPLPVYNLQFAKVGEVLNSYYTTRIVALMWEKLAGLGDLTQQQFTNVMRNAISGPISDISVVDGVTMLALPVPPQHARFQGTVYIPVRDMGEGVLNMTITHENAGLMNLPIPHYRGTQTTVQSGIDAYVCEVPLNTGLSIHVFVDGKPVQVTNRYGALMIGDPGVGEHTVRVYGPPQAWYWSALYEKFTIQSPFVPAAWQLLPDFNDNYYHGLFGYANYLTDIDDDILKYCGEATDLSYVFYSCSNLARIPASLFAYTPKVRSLAHAFDSIGTWNYATKIPIPAGLLDPMPDLEDASFLFYNASTVSEVPSRLLADKPNLNNVLSTFQNTGSALTPKTPVPLDVLDGSTAKITKLISFMENTGTSVITREFFAQFPELVTAAGVFASTYVSEIPADLFDDQPKLTNVNSCFAQLLNLTSVPEHLFDLHEDLEYANSMFAGSGVLEVPPQFMAKCNKLIAMDRIFEGAKGISTVPENWLSNFPLLQSVTYMWSNNQVITSLPSGLFKDNPLLTAANEFCARAANLATLPSDLFQGTKLTGINNGFQNCNSLTEVPDDFLLNLPITSANNLFQNCTSLTRIGNNYMKNGLLASVAGHFERCDAIVAIGNGFCADSKLTDNTAFTSSKLIAKIGDDFCARTMLMTAFATAALPLTEIGSGFYEDCVNITSSSGIIPAGNVITTIGDNFMKGSGLTNATSMFSSRRALVSVGKNFLRGTKVNSIQNIFINCTALTTIGDGSLSDLLFATTAAAAFSGCNNLNTIGNQVLSNNPDLSVITNLLVNCNAIITIGDDFLRNTGLTSVDSLFAGRTTIKTVGNGVFSNMRRLTTARSVFNACSGLTSVGDNLLANNESLTDASYVLNSCTILKSVGNGMLAYTPNLTTITTLFYSTPIETIGDDFCRGSGITGLDSYFRLDTTIKSIGNNFFRGCPNLTSVYRALREMAALVSVGDDCFAECPALTNATALFYTNPVMTTIGDGLLRDCPALSTVDSMCYGTPVLANIGDDFLRNDQNVKTWPSLFGYPTGGTRGLVSIGDNFMRNTGITSALSFFANQTLQLKYVGQNFMRDCASLSNARSIFYQCSELESVGEGMLVGAPITNVYGTFYYCAKLKRIPSDFGADATGITEAAYFAQGCTVLENIPQDLLRGCTGLLTCNNMYMNVKGFKEAPRPDYFKDCPNITSARSAFNGVSFNNGAVFNPALMSKENFPAKNVNLEYFYGAVSFDRTINIADLFNENTAFWETQSIGWAFNGNKSINGAAVPQIQSWRAKVAPSTQPSAVFTNATNLSDYASLTNGWYTA